VLSVGGYAAGPVALAAALLGVPLAILEPNSVVGFANRLLAPVARRAYVAWDEAAVRFRAGARRHFGVPLRHGFAPRPYAATGTARVLVLGGSQGAAALNERMPATAARLADIPGLEVVHQAGQGRDAPVGEAYARAGVTGATVTAFIDEVAKAIAAADVVVARAGAGAVAEITSIGRASILVPFPHAAGDHQAHNAEALARAGAAVCLRQDAADAPRLADELRRLLTDDVARVAMANAARSLGKPDAVQRIAADFLQLAGISSPHAGASRRVAATNGATNGASHSHVRSQEVR
jgi:UDP-N-acetylglucosamine--N-acetylmuramyl-(pentapeptide) pyrophosphoryl-undecaprenol N-acetylglucosamine transferase